MAHAASKTETNHIRALWFGLLAGPIGWSLYFLIGYGLVEVVCRVDFLNFNLFGLSGLALVIIGLTIITLLVILFAGYLAYRNWHRASSRSLFEYSEEETSEGYIQFMTYAGILLSILFGVVTLLTGIAVFFLERPCVY